MTAPARVTAIRGPALTYTGDPFQTGLAATMVYESDLEGPLTIVAGEGETVAVGEPIAYIGEAPAGEAPAPAAAPEAPPAPEQAQPAPAPQPERGRAVASPVARRIAAERAISLAGRSGTGPGGRIVKADVLGWAEAEGDAEAPPAPAPAAGPPPPAPVGGLAAEVREPSRVQAVITLAGLFDFTVSLPGGTNSAVYYAFGGLAGDGSPEMAAASPVTYITADDPPFLILHGDNDGIVPVAQSEILHERLTAVGVPSTLVIVQSGDHSLAGANASPTQAEINEIINAFLAENLHTKQ